jgi:hypothetical protein
MINEFLSAIAATDCDEHTRKLLVLFGQYLLRVAQVSLDNNLDIVQNNYGGNIS